MSGATGLIGSHVRQQWDPRIGELRLVGREHLDLLEPGALAAYVERSSPMAFLHLAWCAGDRHDYRDAAENHSWATVSLEVAARCQHIGTRFVGTGTVLDDVSAPDAYSSSKRRLRSALSDEIGSGVVTWLRPFYVFDPGGRRPAVLGAARSAVAEGRLPALDQPDARHDFVHVDDVARAVVTAVGAGLGGVVEIGSGTLHTVGDLVTRAGLAWEHSGRSVTTRHDQRVADTSLLTASGWDPFETERFFGDDQRR